MGLFSGQKRTEVRPEQKWDYITLNDFKSTSCFTPFAYAYLHFSLALSIAVYSVDTFTAVNLLVFNRWSSEISPTQLISFTASKWIFSICIILSFVNIGYEHIRAQIIMRRGSVAESFLDNLAVRLESIRWGKGKGWKRFLVFAELTKSKKGAEYIALFTYFSFQSWIRVLLCSGPRQAVNALTLLSVYNAQLAVAGGNDVGNTLLDFFSKLRDLAEENAQEVLILSGMIFTLVIWVFSFLSLLMAFLFYVFFLWGYIPRADGGLSGYCSRKINKRLMQIVSTKVNTAIEEEERRRKKAELKAAQKAGVLPPSQATATIPNLGGPDDKLARAPTAASTAGSTGKDFMLQRNDTMATLPPYTSRPGTSASNTFELSNMDQKPPVPRPMQPTRSGTMASMSSMGNVSQKGNFSTRAPLLNYAAEPGRSASPAPSLPMMPEMDGGNMGMSGYNNGNNMNGMNNIGNLNNNYGQSLARPGTAASVRSFGPGGPPQLNRANTGGSMAFNNNAPNGFNGNNFNNGNNYSGNNFQNDGFQNNGNGFQGNNYQNNGYSESPMMMSAELAAPEPTHTPNGYDNRSITGPTFGSGPNGPNGHNPSNSSSSNRYMPFRPDENNGRASPAPSTRSFGPGNGGMAPGMGPGPGPRGMMSPMRSATQPNMDAPRSMTPNGQRGNFGPNGNSSPYGPPQRNMTAPMSQMGGNGNFGGNIHGRQISEDSSYSSYFEQSAPAPGGPPQAQRGPPRRPTYDSAGNGGSNWGNDVESQRGPRY